MEATLSLERKRQGRDIDTNINQCVICQCPYSPHTNVKTSELRDASDTGIKRALEKLAERHKYNDHKFIDFHDRLQHMGDLENMDFQVKWHAPCFSALTNATDIKRLKTRQQSQSTTSRPSADVDERNTTAIDSRRSNRIPVDWKKCMFCQEVKFGKRLFNCRTIPTSDKIIELSKHDSVMRHRLAGVHDLPAAEGKYHLQCYCAFERRNYGTDYGEGNSKYNVCFNEVMEELKKGLAIGEVYSLDTVWTRYCELLSELTVVDDKTELHEYHSRNFKGRMERYLEGAAQFVRPLNPHEPLLVFPALSTGDAMQLLNQSVNCAEQDQSILGHAEYKTGDIETEILSWLYRVAIKVRGDIKATTGHCVIGGITADNAEKVVPKSLYLLLRLMCAKDDESSDTASIHTKLLSIAQDVVFVSSGEKKKTPKHIGLGITIHQATRSKRLVELLHAAGHSISYESVLQVDRSLVSNLLEQYEQNDNIFVPSNIIHGTFKGYLRYANDNIDINEETLDGKGTFHASQSAMFTNTAHDSTAPDVTVPFTSGRTVKVQAAIQELKLSGVGSQQPEPVFSKELDLTSFQPNQDEIDKTELLDMAWLITRLKHAPKQCVPAWSGFNQVLDNDGKQKPISNISHLPLINSPAHDYDTIWTVINRSIDLTLHLGQVYTIITFDEQLYSKAKILQWLNPDRCQNLIIMLGGFHTQLNFARVIGQHMTDSGLKDIWVESGVYGENTADKILQGKSWNRVIRAHKLTLEALWRIMWPAFEDWAHANNKLPDEHIAEIAEEVARGFNDQNEKLVTDKVSEMIGNLTELPGVLKEFDQSMEDNLTYTYWRQYMEMVSILMRFTRALRSGNWRLFLSGLAEMLPWFALYDHTNYTRWGTVFLTDASQLETQAPVVYNGFMNGDFVVKETQHQFNQVPDDQGLEHINKLGKIAGGLVGITRTESARERWSLTYNDRSQLAKCTWTLLGLTSNDLDDNKWDHKDLGPSRIKRDEDDVQKLRYEFESHQVFTSVSGCLTNIITGDVATDEITESLLGAKKKSKEVLERFVNDRLVTKEIGFHKTLHKCKTKTFASLFDVTVTLDKQKTTQIKADRDLFRRLVVSVESGREIQLDNLLDKELSSVPLALATTDGHLRSTNKTQLAQIQEKGNTKTSLNMYDDELSLRACTIIDGMALVHTVGKPAECKNFGDLADTVVKSVCSYFTGSCTRVDIVFDRYGTQSIKSGARRKRRRGIRPFRRVIEDRNVKLPDNWQTYLAMEDNKKEPTSFLSTQLSLVTPKEGCELVISGGFSDPTHISTSNENHDVSSMRSTHEEADTRIILHTEEACLRGYNRVVIVARDTDVLVLLLAFQHAFHDSEVWLKSGTSRKPKFVGVHDIKLSDDIRGNLLAFHALTGCDTTSQFSGIGKVTAWKVFCMDGNAKLLQQLGEEQLSSPEVRGSVEIFVVKLYKPSSTETSIQVVRSAMFRTSKKQLESLPPTQDALMLLMAKCKYFMAEFTTPSNVTSPNDD